MTDMFRLDGKVAVVTGGGRGIGLMMARGLLQAGATGGMNVTSFKCRVYLRTAGPNWLICGEAASMVDPITANGVTAALRHAEEASSLILKFLPPPRHHL